MITLRASLLLCLLLAAMAVNMAQLSYSAGAGGFRLGVQIRIAPGFGGRSGHG